MFQMNRLSLQCTYILSAAGNVFRILATAQDGIAFHTSLPSRPNIQEMYCL